MTRKDDIVASAASLFGYYGFEKTTIDDIADKAGISKGSVYLEFSNKESILVAVVQSFTNTELARIRNLVDEAESPYLEVLRKVLAGHALSYWEIANGQLHSSDLIAPANPTIVSVLLKFQGTVFALIASLLEKAAINKEIEKRKGNREYLRLAELICYLLASLFPPYERLRAPNPAGFNDRVFRRYVDDLVDLALASIRI